MILTRNTAVDVRSLVTVAPVTTRVRKIPVEVPVGKESGLIKPSVINTDLIQTIRKSDLTERAGVLQPAKLQELNEALRFALALDT